MNNCYMPPSTWRRFWSRVSLGWGMRLLTGSMFRQCQTNKVVNLVMFPQPKIFLVTAANQNARKLLSTDLVNTKRNHAHLRKSFAPQPIIASSISLILYIVLILTERRFWPWRGASIKYLYGLSVVVAVELLVLVQYIYVPIQKFEAAQ